MTRRRLLRGGFATALVLGLGALVWRLWHVVTPARVRVLRVLSARDAAVIDKLARILFPPGMALGVDATHMDVAAYVDRYVAAMGRTERWMMRGLFLALDQGTLLSGSWRPLRKLNDAEALAHLKRWESGSGWQHDLVTSAKSVLALAFFAHPDVRTALGTQSLCLSRGPSFWSDA